jgi:hypothetical protein
MASTTDFLAARTPRILWVELTSKCPFDCIFCSRQLRRGAGILFFNPRWAIQFLPQDRLTCVIDKAINSASLYKALYNSVLLMTQRDARSLEDMLA